MASSSPHSSDGATHHETPSTNLTAFSPETVGTANSSTIKQPRFTLRITTDGPSSTHQGVANRTGDDVFLNEPASATASTQLSPVAETFTPGTYTTPSNAAPRAGGFSRPIGPGDNTRTGPGVIGSGTHVSNLLSGSVPDDVDYASAQEFARGLFSSLNAGPGGPGPYPSMATLVEDSNELRGRIDDLATQLQGTTVSTILLQHVVVRQGTFSTNDQKGRAVLVCGVPQGFPEYAIRGIFTQTLFNSLIAVSCKNLNEHGVVHVGLSNINDAVGVEHFLKNAQPLWTTRRISPKQYIQQAFGNATDTVSDYEAQLIVTVFFDGNESVLAAPVLRTLKEALEHFGYLKAIHSIPAHQQHAREFRVEYEDTRSALCALSSLDSAVIDNLVLKVVVYQPDITPPADGGDHPDGGPPGPPSPPAPPAGRPHNGSQVLSVTGRSLIPMSGQHSYGGNRMRGSIFNSPPRRGRLDGRLDRFDCNSNHNQVIIEKIEAGLDVRTTIMLRNIPNKITSQMLKDILDETSLGDYDFMYLRIDFANNCNVGYAFINFVDALAIIPFAVRRAGQRWNTFSSDKVAEISYATIQGKDCLVQKFRNSSVMLEDPDFRPKLFRTGNGPDAGDEEKFPGPDNHSKMRRSVENAEHVGLFTPTVLSPPTRPLITHRTLVLGNSTMSNPAVVYYPVQTSRTRPGTYLPPARAMLPAVAETAHVCGSWQDLGSSMPPVQSTTYTQAPIRHRAPEILTPSTSNESLRSTSSAHIDMGRVDTRRADDPFSGTRTIRPSAPPVDPNSLFAPRQGQAFREEQRRRRSQFDRGTPGAEYEAYNYRLTDPALSPVHTPYAPRSNVYDNNLGSYNGALYVPGAPIARPGYGYY